MISLIFTLSAPLPYILGFKGELKTPIGYLRVTNRAMLRSSVYGFFKTQFAYRHGLRALFPKDYFFPLIIDVGANIGDLPLAMKRHAGKIIALEPGEENFSALNANLQINHVDNAVPVRVAATDREGEVFLQGENSNMYVNPEKKGHPARGSPLDLIVDKLKIGSVDLLKVDAQGHERFVLLGMNSLMRRRLVKLLIVEAHVKRGVSVADIVSFMEARGYYLVHRDPYLFDQPHLYFASSELRAS